MVVGQRPLSNKSLTNLKFSVFKKFHSVKLTLYAHAVSTSATNNKYLYHR